MSKHGFFLGKEKILESLDHSNSLKFYSQIVSKNLRYTNVMHKLQG